MRLAAVVTVAVLAGAPAASAAEVNVGDYALSAYSQHAIYSSAAVRDIVGETNVIDASQPRAGTAQIIDSAATLSPALRADGAGACAFAPRLHEAICAGACLTQIDGYGSCSALLNGFFANLGAGDDRVAVRDFAAAVLTGGPGRDYLSVGDVGSAFIDASDGEVDRIHCGSGDDFVLHDADDVILNPGACEQY